LRPAAARAIQGLLGPGWGGRRAFADATRAARYSSSPSPTLTARSQPPIADTTERAPTSDTLASAHARFARAALTIYLAAAAASIALLIVALVTDKAHDEDQIREQLLLETDVRAHSLSQRLGLLVDELRRLSERSEVDLRDQDLAPEKSLLQLSHGQSTFFNVGVAILDTKGAVVWSEPPAFLAHSPGFGQERWFGSVQKSRAFRIVPVQPDRPDSVLYVVSPLVRGTEFTGALLGAVDLARGEAIGNDKPTARALTVVATADGQVVYPPIPPRFSSDEAWRALFTKPISEPFTARPRLAGAPTVVAASPVSGTELLLMSVGKQDELFRPTRARLRTRLIAGLSLALTPAILLLLMLQRSLKVFRKSEEAAVREERLRLLGEAANSIAHEVKNALNGLSMGLDLVVRAAGDPIPGSKPGSPMRAPVPAERRERIVGELRREIQRLSEFTTELMTFSRGVEPRRSKIDLTDFVPKVTGLLQDSAEELGAVIDVITPKDPTWVEADGALLHAVISNLAGNALDAAVASSPSPRVEVRVTVRGTTIELRVSDNGAGVSASMRPRLFEPFQSEKPNGVGIGLALARKIARAHGGDLVLDELPRPAYPGASFLLTLPLLIEPVEEEEGERA
jgi:two-component system C4-dicarboxylate transport sensor histidine kinase DctB